MANVPRSNTNQGPSETRLYTLTIDDGAAPCAPPPTRNSPALLTLAICKPVSRQKMQAGDVLIGLTGAIIAENQDYPRNSIVYSAVVDQIMPGKDYYTSTWAHRLDCIYRYDPSSGKFVWIPTTNIHAELEEQKKDIGRDNATVLVCRDFRYFGKDAVEIPDRLRHMFRSGRGDPVLRNEGETGRELERLHQHLWSKQTRYTPTTLNANGPRRSSRDDDDVDDGEMDDEEEGAEEDEEEDGRGPAPRRSHKCSR